MKATELIRQLEAIVHKHGANVEIAVDDRINPESFLVIDAIYQATPFRTDLFVIKAE